MSESNSPVANAAAIDSTSSLFVFEVDGVEIGRFTELEGLELDVDVVTFGEGGVNGHEHKFPGRVSWPNLVLRAGLTRSDALFSWVQRSSGDGLDGAGKLERNTAAVTIVGQDGTRMRSWEVEGAFAVRWKGPRFSVNDGAVPIEELEISHHGFRPRDLA